MSVFILTSLINVSVDSKMIWRYKFNSDFTVGFLSFVNWFLMGRSQPVEWKAALAGDPSLRALPPQPLDLSLFCPLEDIREHEMQGPPLKGIARVLVWLLENNFPAPSPPVAPNFKQEFVEVGSRQRRQGRHWQG